jgi:hypothetical protein
MNVLSDDSQSKMTLILVIQTQVTQTLVSHRTEEMTFLYAERNYFGKLKETLVISQNTGEVWSLLFVINKLITSWSQ